MQDSETGEPEFRGVEPRVEIISYNEETGEPDMEFSKYSFQKTKFMIPKEYLQKSSHITKRRCYLSNSKDTYTLSSKNKVYHLKEEIILGYNKTSHRMFLIPSLIFFTKITALLITVFEIVVHVWAHKKNSKNTNPNIYYRSPLHILTSEFCAICRSQADADHINKLQDQSRKIHANINMLPAI